jgi:hypothetical protein
MSQEIISLLIGQVIAGAFGGLGVYAAIRADLAQLNARVKFAEDHANKAHERIDNLMRK